MSFHVSLFQLNCTCMFGRLSGHLLSRCILFEMHLTSIVIIIDNVETMRQKKSPLPCKLDNLWERIEKGISVITVGFMWRVATLL